MVAKIENKMKEQLIKLAKEKGFISNIHKAISMQTNDSLYEYLWMCELQKWLRDEHDIHVTADRVEFLETSEKGYMWIIYNQKHNAGEELTTYEVALEKGLLEALKLIK